MTLTEQQEEVCREYDASFVAAPSSSMVGIARNVAPGAVPLNALRHPVEGNVCGWYVWAGEELSEDPEFFRPLHVAHLADRCPEILRYLGLAPGWRVLLAGDYVDVWFDESLLNPSGT